MTYRMVGMTFLALAACSDLSSSDETVVALQVTSPPGAAVEVGDVATVFGRTPEGVRVPVEDFASGAGTLGYEILVFVLYSAFMSAVLLF